MEWVGGKRVTNHRRFTWTVLKGRTRNRAGTVHLRSADPREVPQAMTSPCSSVISRDIS